MVSLDEAARLATALPDVTDGERHGLRTWSVAGKAFAWDRPFSKADLRRFGDATPPDGPILALRVEDLSEKETILAATPEAFFTIPHFDGYPAILVHLKTAKKPALREAILDAWLACAPPSVATAYLGRAAVGPFLFEAALWRWEANAGWHFLTVPSDISDAIRALGEGRGFGSVRVEATVGSTSWKTSVFPDTKRDAFVLPVKQQVRKAEHLEAGDRVAVTLVLPDR